jgi:hypothetical protein
VSLLSEIGTFLAAQSGLGALGTTLFLGAMPASPDVCGALYEYGGLAPSNGFGVVGVQYEFPAVQVVFRGTKQDYATTRAKAETAYRALAGVQPDTLLSGTRYLQIRPQQAPFLMRRDDDDRVYFAANYVCEKELSAA